MPAPGFGRTWWGAQWLFALSQIDFDNRLPRGRSYANKGAVQQLAVSGGAIQARVAGSRPQPYAVHITVPALGAQDAARLLDRLAADPSLIARLLNRELDPVVLDIANTLGVGVFPASWKDLAMQCSCPDWAVPCKHLAAVIYLLSREIDADPFLVFSLRGLDLAAGLKARQVHIEPDAAARLPTLHELLLSDEPAARGPGEPDTLAALDLSRVPNLLQPLWRVLPAKPSFFDGSAFTGVAQRLLTRVAKAARLALDAGVRGADGAADTSTRFDADDTELAGDAFDAQDQPTLLLDADGGVALAGMVSPCEDGFAGLAERLGRLPPWRLAELQVPLAALHAVRLVALQLLAQGALVPQVHAAGDGQVVLRWLPATLDEAVCDLLEQLAAALPGGLLRLQATGKGRSGAKPKPLALGATAQAQALCGIFCRYCVQRWSGAELEKGGGNKVLALFFGSGSVHFDGLGESAVPASIQSWLARLHLLRQQHRALLRLEEHARSGFALSLAVEDTAQALQPPVPLAKVLADKRWAKTRLGVLQQVAMLAEFFPPLNTHVRAGAATPMLLAADALPTFLFDALPAVRVLGIRVLMPKALERLLRPRLSLQLKASAGASGGLASVLSAAAIFSFDWKVAIGEHLVSSAEFERLLKKAGSVVRFKGEYLYLDPSQIEGLRAQLERPPKLGAAELLRLALAGEYAGAPLGLDTRAQALVQQLLDAGEVAAPAALQAELRPYQLRGYAWLYRNAHAGLGSVIADDMGLGKTLQVIAALLKLKAEGGLADATALVVMPTTLLSNWQAELARFAPSLSVGVFHGTKRELKGARPDVLLTSYGVVRSEAVKLATLNWRLVVADEAQNIKNPAAAQTRALKALTARSFIAMSGTPVENRLSEYWSIMDFANRGYLGSLAHFTREYAAPIQTHRDPHALQRFKRVTAPFVLRRLKADRSIISDLPDKIEQDQYCALTPAQSALYESVLQAALRSLAGESETFKRQALVLQMILALKQICNHPAQYLKQGPRGAEGSGKAARLLELMADIHAAGEKLLVFTQFRESGEMLCDWLTQRHARRPAFLHGASSRAQRDTMVERFQHDRTERVLVLSLKAGGTGLNLTAASQVIHFDLWWNPAVQAQATDRAYRIGQQRKVQVHRFIVRGTFEEKINDMMRSKRELAELTVGSGEQWVGSLPTSELQQLFALRRSTDEAKR